MRRNQFTQDAQTTMHGQDTSPNDTLAETNQLLAAYDRAEPLQAEAVYPDGAIPCMTHSSAASTNIALRMTVWLVLSDTSCVFFPLAMRPPVIVRCAICSPVPVYGSTIPLNPKETINHTHAAFAVDLLQNFFTVLNAQDQCVDPSARPH